MSAAPRLLPAALARSELVFAPRDAVEAAAAVAIERMRVARLRGRILRFALACPGAPPLALPADASDTCVRALAELVWEQCLFFCEIDATFHLTPAGKLEALAAEAAARARKKEKP